MNQVETEAEKYIEKFKNGIPAIHYAMLISNFEDTLKHQLNIERVVLETLDRNNINRCEGCGFAFIGNARLCGVGDCFNQD